LAIPTTRSAPLGAIHLILDLEAASTFPDPLRRVRCLLEAGLPSLQLRGPGLSSDELVRAGAPFREAARGRARFLVNGDADAARRLEADGLHLPARSGTARAARSEFPAGFPIGSSVHDESELLTAAEADWVFLSPVFPTRSKPGASGLGVRGLQRLLRGAPVPVYALGGISARNLRPCLAAGCAGVAAIRALLGDDGPRLVRDALSFRADR
jgi:thiamine-phosphate diphosphorylase